MPTSGNQEGDILTLTVDGTEVTHSIEHGLSASMATIEVTSKDSNKWKTSIAGDKSWSFSGSAYMLFGGAYTFTDLFALWTAGASFTAVLTTSVTGDSQYTGSVNITALEKTASHGSAVEISYTLEGTGPLTEGTVS